MKKLLITLALVFLVSVFVGCSIEESAGGSGDVQTDETSETVETPDTNVDFPTKDISFIIPNGPGGGNDLTVRALIQGLEGELGVTVVPENQPASGGAVAAMELANATPDGYMLYFNSQTLLLMPHGGMEDIKLENYQPVAQIVEDTASVIVKADAPYDTLDEFIDYVQNSGNKMRMAHNGVGALWYLSAVTLAESTGLDFQYVAYQDGGSQMLTAVAAGEADVAVISPSEAKGLIDSGEVKVLTVLSENRHPVVPEVPTTIEEGVDSTFPVWRGIFTTAGVDEAILEVLESAIYEATQTPEFQEFLEVRGMPEKFRGYEEFTEFVNEEKEIYDRLMSNLD